MTIKIPFLRHRAGSLGSATIHRLREWSRVQEGLREESRSTKAPAAAFRSRCIVPMSIWPGTMTQLVRKQRRRRHRHPPRDQVGPAGRCILYRRARLYALYPAVALFPLITFVAEVESLALNYTEVSRPGKLFSPLRTVPRITGMSRR